MCFYIELIATEGDCSVKNIIGETNNFEYTLALIDKTQKELAKSTRLLCNQRQRENESCWENIFLLILLRAGHSCRKYTDLGELQ